MEQRKYNRIDYRITDYCQWKKWSPLIKNSDIKGFLNINKQPKADQFYLACRYTMRVKRDNFIFFHFHEILKTILIHIDVRFVSRIDTQCLTKY